METNVKTTIMGGFAIKSSSPVLAEHQLYIANECIKKVKDYFDCDCCVLGSTGKKNNGETSGDIDIAIDLSWSDRDDFLDFINNTYKNVDTNVLEGFKIVSVGVPYKLQGQEKIAQVDFCFSKNMDFTKFINHSPNYRKNESNFKGLYRTNLFSTVASKLNIVDDLGADPEKYGPEEFTEADGYDKCHNGETKSFWKLSLDHYNGLKLVHKTFVSKKMRKPLKNPATIEEDTRIITNNPDKIVKIVLGARADMKDVNSVESLIDFLTSDKFMYHSEGLLDNIFEAFFEDPRHQHDEKALQELKDLVKSKRKHINESKIIHLNEGIDFDYANHTVSYVPFNEDNVDTSLENNPTYDRDLFSDIRVWSIFKRKRGEKGDGNPLVYALKGENHWKFRTPYDKQQIDAQFNKIAEKFSKIYPIGVTILIPTQSGLNRYIANIIMSKSENSVLVPGVIRKLTTEEIDDIVLEPNSYFRKYYKDNFDEAYDAFLDYLENMNRNHGCYFSRHFVKNGEMRDILTETMTASTENFTRKAEQINGKDILLIDDTISRGQSIREACKIIQDTYSPKSITVLTLLSKLY